MEIKLLDLNNDWQQVRPSVAFENGAYTVRGYQDYCISKSQIIPMSDNLCNKMRLVEKTIEGDVVGNTVVDIGCSNMFFGFLSHFLGATQVVGIDLDNDYLNQNDYLIDECSMKETTCKSMNVVDFKDPMDTVFAFAIIHWVYSCTGFLGSLENVVKHFRSITKKCLYIEWIDPSDNCIADVFHHLDFNKEYAVQDYSKDNFIKYLKDNFAEVKYLGNSKYSREIYRCLV